MRANPIFLSHTDVTRSYFPAGMGEIANTQKINTLLLQSGHRAARILDVFELFGDPKGLFTDLSHLNIELAYEGHPPIQVGLKEVNQIKNELLKYSPSSLYVLSYSWTLAALLACGIENTFPLCSKLYVHHAEDIIPRPLYEGCHLLITESPLAQEKACMSGIDCHRVLYLPHHYPKGADQMDKSRQMLYQMAQKRGKKIEITDDTWVIGCASRLAIGKNVEYALDVAHYLHESGYPIFFVLKGGLEGSNPYQLWLEEKLVHLQKESWFLWDSAPCTLEEMQRFYASLDMALQLSGAEAGSNTIVELLAHGVPTIVLNASTNPSLFTGAALFVEKKPEPISVTTLPFFRPDFDDLKRKTVALIQDKKECQLLSKKAKEHAISHFSPERSLSRIPHLMNAPLAYFRGGRAAQKMKEEMERLNR